MYESTDLARGAINGEDHLSVELIQPDRMPPRVCASVTRFW
jgi:hypothetical protein